VPTTGFDVPSTLSLTLLTVAQPVRVMASRPAQIWFARLRRRATPLANFRALRRSTGTP
jgi:hypothetical protein